MNIACLQLVSTTSVSENLSLIETLLAKSAIKIDMLALPENFAEMTTKEKNYQAEILDKGPVQDFISKLARKYQCWIQSGTIPIKSEEDGKIYAAASLYSDNGDRVYTYNKQYLFDVTISDTESYRESDTFKGGREVPSIIDTPFGKIGIMVCYDLRFAENVLALQGADIIFVPSAFTFNTGQHHWLPLLKARAIELQCYVVGCNQGGLHQNGRHTYGHSAIFDPYGKLLANTEEGNALIDAVIDLAYVQQVRQCMPMAYSRKMRVTDA